MPIQCAKVVGTRITAVDAGCRQGNAMLVFGAEHVIDCTPAQNIPAQVLRITIYGAQGVAVFATSK